MVKSSPSLYRAYPRLLASRFVALAAKLPLRKLKRRAVTSLPKRAVLAATHPTSLFWTLTIPGGRHVASYMRSAYRTGRLSSIRQAAAWKAHKYREAVLAVRLEEGKERIADWPVVHHNRGPFERLVREGRPFLLVTGHFAAIAAYRALDTHPVASITATHGLPAELSPIQRQFVGRPTSAGANVRFVHVGQPSLPVVLARQLTTPNTMLILILDGQNDLAPHWRPFAGYASYPCQLHAARLARLAQCPVVFNSVTWDKRGRVYVEWSNSFDPPARHDRAGETALTDALFDELEAAIGRHPTQYTWTTGFDRYWDGRAACWRSRKEQAPRRGP